LFLGVAWFLADSVFRAFVVAVFVVVMVVVSAVVSVRLPRSLAARLFNALALQFLCFFLARLTACLIFTCCTCSTTHTIIIYSYY